MKTKYRFLLIAFVLGIGACGIIDPKNKGKGFNIDGYRGDLLINQFLRFNRS